MGTKAGKRIRTQAPDVMTTSVPLSFKEQSPIRPPRKTQIESTDAQIDSLDYQLYDLTDAEIAIVEDA